MSTRGLIGRVDEDGVARFRYHHFDSYCDGLGRTLYQLYNGHFEHDLKHMERFLLDEHYAWSTINNADFSLTPGYYSYMSEEYVTYADYEQSENGRRPQCYCHGERSEGPYDFVTQDNTDTWAEYAYVLDTSPDGDVMACCAKRKYLPDGFVPRRQYGIWSAFAIVPLDGPEPDWGTLEPRDPEEEDECL